MDHELRKVGNPQQMKISDRLSGIGKSRDTGEWGHDGSIFPLPFQKGSNGAEVLF